MGRSKHVAWNAGDEEGVTVSPTPSQHAISLETSVGQSIIKLQGEIDVAAESELRRALDKALLSGSRLVIDLSETTFLDSTGLNIIVQAHHRSGRLQEALVLRSPSVVVQRLLKVTGISDLVTVEKADKRKAPAKPKRQPIVELDRPA